MIGQAIAEASDSLRTNELLSELITVVREKPAMVPNLNVVPVSQRQRDTPIQTLLKTHLEDHPELRNLSVRKLAMIKVDGKTYSKSSWDRARRKK